MTAMNTAISHNIKSTTMTSSNRNSNSNSDSKSSNSIVVIGGHEVEDESNPYPRPLFLVPLPPLSLLSPPSVSKDNDDDDHAGRIGFSSSTVGVDLLAYGGDDGHVYHIPHCEKPEGATNTTKSSSSSSSLPRVIRKYDDEVRALAVSPDGRRIALGFDDGSTKIYAFDHHADDDDDDDGNGNVTENYFMRHHPFLPPTSKASTRRADGDNDSVKNDAEDDFINDDYGGGFLSQADDDYNNSSRIMVEFDGPRLDASIRQLAFDPHSGSDGQQGRHYYLAIGSESGHSPLVIVDVATESSVSKASYLGDKSGEEHRGSGVRSVAYSLIPTTTDNAHSSSSSSISSYNVLLATLGMDGKLVTWDVSTYSTDPSLLWEVVHADMTAVVPRPDLGLHMGSNAGDSACRVVWDIRTKKMMRTTQKQGNDHEENDDDEKDIIVVLYFPGKTDIQYRLVPVATKKNKMMALTTDECAQHLKGPPKFIMDGEGGGHGDTIVAMAVPPPDSGFRVNNNNNGTNQIVTGGRDGRLFLWNMDLHTGEGTATELRLERRTGTFGIPPITSIIWPHANELHVAFADGTVSTVPVNVDQAASKKTKKVVEKSSEDAKQPVLNEEIASGVKESAKQDNFDDTDDDNDMFDEDALSGENKDTTSTTNKQSASRFIDDEAEDGGDEDDDSNNEDNEIQYDDVNKPSSSAAITHSNDSEVNDNDDDNGNDFDGDDDNMFDSHNDNFDDDAAPAANISSNHQVMSSMIPLQPAFAPSSTPLGEPHRILCWNHLGVISTRPDVSGDHGIDSNNNLIDIAFLETAGLVGGRRPITFTDNVGFIVGTLGEGGALFASDILEDDEDDDADEFDDDFGVGVMSEVVRKVAKRSQRKSREKGGGTRGSSVYFHRFETFGRNADKDWVIALPDGERVLGCATGSGWGAVITSRRFLRLFTISGLQGPVLWIPGDPVTVVGRNRFVAVFYHRSVSPMQDGTQLLGYSIFDGLTGAVVVSGEVSALSSGASLSWAGFTDKCALSVMDSDGMLSMLARYPGSNYSCNGNWMPLLDTVGLKKNASDSYWPCEVHGGKLICVPLRGRDYPDATRRPVTTALSLRIPLATGLTVKSGPFEEYSIRAIFALNQEKVLDEYLVAQGEANEDEIEEEYIQNCNKVDKVTLKLFASVVQAGKVERGFDLVQRLHSEKAMDLAIQMADRVGHRKLSDRIEEVKLQKYPPIDDYFDEQPFDDSASFDSGRCSERSVSFGEAEPAINTRQQRYEYSKRISPEVGRVHTPSQGRSASLNKSDEEQYSTDEESPPRESLKRKLEQDDAPNVMKRINPFAKKKLESPAKGIMKIVSSPTKLSLSRSSTFSAKSRQKQRSGKQIV